MLQLGVKCIAFEDIHPPLDYTGIHFWRYVQVLLATRIVCVLIVETSFHLFAIMFMNCLQIFLEPQKHGNSFQRLLGFRQSRKAKSDDVLKNILTPCKLTSDVWWSSWQMRHWLWSCSKNIDPKLRNSPCFNLDLHLKPLFSKFLSMLQSIPHGSTMWQQEKRKIIFNFRPSYL